MRFHPVANVAMAIVDRIDIKPSRELVNESNELGPLPLHTGLIILPSWPRALGIHPFFDSLSCCRKPDKRNCASTVPDTVLRILGTRWKHHAVQVRHGRVDCDVVDLR